MSDLPAFTIAPETKFSDIMVPTLDTVRGAHLIEMLLTNNKTVCDYLSFDIMHCC